MEITDFRHRQSKEAAQIAAAAFADDPLWSHTVPDPERRRLPHLIMLGTALRRIGPPQIARVAMEDDRIIGFSHWTTAGSDDPYDPFDASRPVDPHMARATRKLVRRAASDWPRLSALYATLGQSYPNDPGWFLGVLAVHPDHQGRGVGTALLRDGLDRVDLDDQPVSLQTSTPGNVDFYRRHGFEVSRTFAELYPGSPPLWTMRRPAASHAKAGPSEPDGARPS